MSRAPGKGGRGKTRAAGELVRDVLRRAGIAESVREHRIVTEWADIVGDRVATRAWPIGLAAGVLRVRVSNSAWLQELSFLREALVARANEIVGGEPVVKEIRFTQSAPKSGEPSADDLVAVLARKRKPPKPAPPVKVQVSAATRERIERETDRIVDPELRAALKALRLKVGS